jgi:hypothetical protein
MNSLELTFKMLENVYMIEEIFGVKKPLIGVIHLLPLPGSPRYHGDLDAIVERALRDAESIFEGGADALLLENYGDFPFYPDRVGPETVAVMSVIASKLREKFGKPLGINVLRNDSLSALAISIASGASFIRVNVHTGASVTDQGILLGKAHETLRYRKILGADIKIFADLSVKHGSSMRNIPLELDALETFKRGLADALIVTGYATGEETALEEVKRVKESLPNVPLFIGSGINPDNIGNFAPYADGFIVGTFLKKDGITENPVDRERVRLLVDKLREISI